MGKANQPSKGKPQGDDVVMQMIVDVVSLIINGAIKFVSWIAMSLWGHFAKKQKKSNTAKFRLNATDREKLTMTRKYYEEKSNDEN